MTAPATLDDPHRMHPGASSRREAPDELGKYQFQVVAANIADVKAQALIAVGAQVIPRMDEGFYSMA